MEYTPIEDFDYEIKDNHLIINKYISNNNIVNIPETYTIDNKEYKVTTINKCCFYANTKIKEVNLPDTITEIRSSAFEKSSIEKIKLPNKIKKLAPYVFSHCENLIEIQLPNSIKSIGKGCFFYCSSLEKIKLSTQLEIINENAFENCRNLNNIELPQNLKAIEIHSFSKCSRLKQIIIPENIKEIKQYVFNNCKNLEKITLPQKLKGINVNAFGYCTNLKKINISKEIEHIDLYAFVRCDNLELENFENQYIRIKNNNIYRKGIENNKTIYYLTNCNQKDAILNIKENEEIEVMIQNKYINSIRSFNKEIKLDVWEEKIIQKNQLDTVILPNIENLEEEIFTENIKNLYCCKLKKIDFYKHREIENFYIDQTKDQIKEIKHLSKHKNIIYKKDINELLENDYNFKQIDQIIKGYQKSILLSNINPDVNENILRNIINNFNYEDIELYDLLELLQKEELDLNTLLEIEQKIQTKQEQNYNKEIDTIER